MKTQPSPLDYADIVLSQSRTRCELYVCCNGIREKLTASTQTKPFLAQLRAAELQFERGNGIVRLEPPRRISSSTWFTKSTMERFMHFVNFPEVLERVKDIRDELVKLKEVRAALFKTFSTNDHRFGLRDAPFSSSDVYQEKSTMIMEKGNENEKAVETSKRQLLRAIDARLVAVNQELNMALSHALSAGFDNSALSDLIKFAEHFGAERLRDACLHFLNSSFPEGMNMSEQEGEYLNSQSGDDSLIDSDMSVDSSTEMEMNSSTEIVGVAVDSMTPDSWSNSQMSRPLNTDLQGKSTTRVRGRWGPPERIQISCMESELQDYESPSDVSDGEEDRDVSIQRNRATRNSGEKQSNSKLQSNTHFSPSQKASEHIARKGIPLGSKTTFFSHLQKMAKQIEARKLIEDQGMHFTSVAINNESQVFKGKSLTVSGLKSNSPKDIHATEFSDIRTVTVTQPRDQEDSTPVESSSLVTYIKEEQERGRKSESTGSESKMGIRDTADPEGTQSSDQLEESVSTSSKRISVQAAISLFESKKAAEPVVKKLVRQDSLKGSTSQKTVVRRWSIGGPLDNNIQQKATEMFVAKDTQETVDVGLASVDNQTSSRNKDAISNFDSQCLPHKEFSQESMCMKSMVSNHTASNIFSSHEPTTRKQPTPPVEFSSQLIGGRQNQFKLELELSLARKNRISMDVDASNLMAAEISEIPELKHLAGISKASDLIPNSLAQDKIPELLQSKQLSLLDSADIKTARDMSQTHPSKVSNRKHGSEFDSNSKMLSKVHTTEFLSTRTASPFSARPLGRTDSPAQSFEEDQILEVFPLTTALDIPKNMSQKSKKIIHAPRDVQSVKATAKHKGVSNQAGQRMDSVSKKPELYESVSATSKEDKITNNVLITSRKESSVKGTAISKPEHVMDRNSQAPVDLYMQTLAVMNDNRHQSSTNSSDHEDINEQEGRLYEQYQKLRDARQLKENPTKRAEREAKLRCMKATLDKRKIEMETGVQKNSKYTKEKVNAGKIQPQKTQAARQLKEPEIIPKGHMTTDQAQTSKQGVSNLQKSSSKVTSSSIMLSSSKSPLGTMRRKSDPHGRSENSISQSTSNITDIKDGNRKQSPKVLQVAKEARTFPLQQTRTEFMVSDIKNSVRRSALHKSERLTPTMHPQKIKRDTDAELSNNYRIVGTKVEDLRNSLRPQGTRNSIINTICMASNSLKEEENQSDSTEEDSDVFLDASCDERVLSMDEIDQHTAVPEGAVKLLEASGLARQVSEAIIRKVKLHENAYDFGNN